MRLHVEDGGAFSEHLRHGYSHRPARKGGRGQCNDWKKKGEDSILHYLKSPGTGGEPFFRTLGTTGLHFGKSG